MVTKDYKDYIFQSDIETNPNKDYSYDQNVLDSKIANRDYEGAINYARQYHPTDPAKLKAWNDCIDELERNGRIVNAIYTKVDDKTKRDKIEFYNNVFLPSGGIVNSDNIIANRFKDMKKGIGSKYDENGNYLEATKLSVSFAPEEQSLFGLDFLYPDNKYNIDNFYKQSGLNRQILEQQGVTVTKDSNNNTVLTFDKSNPLANKILYNVPSDPNKYRGDSFSINISDKTPIITGYDSNDNKLGTNYGISRAFKHLINDAKNTKDAIYAKNELVPKNYASIIGPSLTDDLDALNEQYNSGAISPNDYNKLLKREDKEIIDQVKSIASGQWRMYSNAKNKFGTDETLDELDNVSRAEVATLISSTPINRLRIQSMVAHGTIGTFISIDADPKSTKAAANDNMETTVDEMIKTRRLQVFIPGFLQDKVQSKINDRSEIKAAQELDNMQDYGYKYKCVNGKTLQYDGNGGYIKDNDLNNILSKEEASKEIEKDIICKHYKNNLKFKHLNVLDQLIDTDGYRNEAKEIAIKAANSLYPNIPLVKEDGTKMTIDEIYNYIWETDSSYGITKNGYTQLQYEQYSKVKEIFEIYQQIMSGIDFYKQ